MCACRSHCVHWQNIAAVIGCIGTLAHRRAFLYRGKSDHTYQKGTVEATPSVISFKYETEWGTNAFNVDRKTLKAGSGTKRDYTCVLQDIDTSENLL